MDVKTTKPISTISYNSAEHLEFKLEALRKARIIEFWAFIEHQPEEDEDKAHKHVLVHPAKLIQTEDIRDELKEFDPTHPTKPLGCQPFRHTATFGDWYLYGKHDPAYLTSKLESRKYHYKHDDFRTSDDDFLNELVKDIDRTTSTPYGRMREAISQGLSFDEFVALGGVPLPQIIPYEKAWFSMSRGNLMRKNRTHTPKDDSPLTKAEAEARAHIEKAEREAQEMIRKARIEEEARANVDRYLEGFDEYITPPTSAPDNSVVIDTKTGEAHELAEYDPEGELPF